MSRTDAPEKTVASNRKARHDYEILETVEAGVMLTGTEVKSLRAGRAQMRDAFATLKNGRTFLHGIHIPPYDFGSHWNHDPERPRQLLLHRAEFEKLAARVD